MGAMFEKQLFLNDYHYTSILFLRLSPFAVRLQRWTDESLIHLIEKIFPSNVLLFSILFLKPECSPRKIDKM